MALFVFRSKAAGEIFTTPEVAHRLLDIIGKTRTPAGVITASEVDAAAQRLQAAVDAEKDQLKAARAERTGTAIDDADTGAAAAITLGQRAFPLLDMLRAAGKKRVDVTWGI